MTYLMALPVLFAVAAVTVFLVGDRVRPDSWRQTDDEAAGHMVLDLVNMFFAAIVAFVVVILWQQYDNAHAHTVSEAKGLVTVYEASNDMPEPDRTSIQSLVRQYTSQVVTDEWTSMEKNRELNQGTQDTFDELRSAVGAVPTTDPSVKDSVTGAQAGLDAVAEARYDRGLDARYRLPTFLYVALWFGTAMLLLGTVFSGVLVTKRSVIMTGLFGVVVGAVIMAVYQLDQPFAGGNQVSKEAYELALSRFQHITSSGVTAVANPR
ncbi:bestrophin-like domain [Nocardia jejuensis]|uniref:bestrophin-like domain n=1 Tax=Nocardia jejuensis TaxID=328049 RepID=UPI000832B890|nr:DUF4239 domain-containing protein [Nocardia jejuensis]